MKFYLPVEKKMSRGLKVRQSVYKKTVRGNREPNSKFTNCAPSSITLWLLSSTSDQESSFERSELRCKSCPISRSQTRLSLVEQPSEGVQWRKHSTEPRVRCHTNRCHQSRLGTSFSEQEIKGSLIFEREPVSH
jgi:hypothetical protein